MTGPAATALLALAAALAPPPDRTPTAADVQEAETARIYEPITDYTPDGRAYVEFAPTVETRNASCRRLAHAAWECRYESRTRHMLARDFTPWEARRQRLDWRDTCWRFAADAEG